MLGRSAGNRLPVTPYRGSAVIRIEWNLEILLGEYFAAKGLLGREYGSLSVVSPSGFPGGEQIADGLG